MHWFNHYKNPHTPRVCARNVLVRSYCAHEGVFNFRSNTTNKEGEHNIAAKPAHGGAQCTYAYIRVHRTRGIALGRWLLAEQPSKFARHPAFDGRVVLYPGNSVTVTHPLDSTATYIWQTPANF